VQLNAIFKTDESMASKTAGWIFQDVTVLWFEVITTKADATIHARMPAIETRESHGIHRMHGHVVKPHGLLERIVFAINVSGSS
jgi:hypothetical protein